jgi:AcrR family transcriptional regulator
MATEETREKILDAAERLFAAQGFGATSLRTVINEANVNLAAVHYHFGSKEALIRAVFARRLEPLNDDRLRRLETLEAGAPQRRVEVEDLLDAFLRPALVLAGERDGQTPLLTQLLGRLHGESAAELRTLVYDQFAEVGRRYVDAFARSLPELPAEDLYTRFHFVVGTMASCFADPQRLDWLSGGVVSARDIDALVARMVRFLAAGLRASTDAPEHTLARADTCGGRRSAASTPQRPRASTTLRSRANARRPRIVEPS